MPSGGWWPPSTSRWSATPAGRVVWDLTPYAYQTIDADCPATVNPSLWRQAQLNSIHGLFEVAPGIYQVRGLDLSNMTIIEGDTRDHRVRPADLV